MKPIKFKRVEFRKPGWGFDPQKTKTDNEAWRKGLFVVFEDYNGQEFDWMPRWDQVVLITGAKESADIINSDLAKEAQKRKGRE